MILLIDTTSEEIKVVIPRLDRGTQVITTREARQISTLIKGEKPTAIGVVTGPGSFTGIRLGIAYAKGLALGWNIPLIGINIFELAGGFPAPLRGGIDCPTASPSSAILGGGNGGGILAIKSDRGDYFVCRNGEFGISKELPNDAALIKDYDLTRGLDLVAKKLKEPPEPVIPLYIRQSYVDLKGA